jgi:nicotinamide-nucleotide amidase
MPNAEIIAIGTELLLGEILDTNTRFIAQVLRSLGIDLLHTQTVGDNAGRIAHAVHLALERADIVITTGGLGPTVDDPTRQAIATSVGAQLEYRPELWEQIKAHILRYGRTPTKNQKRQAYIPKNAIIIENPVGTAPAFIVEITDRSLKNEPGHTRSQLSEHNNAQAEKNIGKVIISLPGVPREMETLLTRSVVPYLHNHFELRSALIIRTLHVSGLGEGMIDDQIGDLEKLANPTVGLSAHSGVVDIRITARGSNMNETSQMITSVEKELNTRLGENIFGADEDNLESAVLRAIMQRDWTFACLEVNLAGLLLKRFSQTEHPVYKGGISSQIQPKALAIETELIRKQFNASVALGVAFSQEHENQDVYIALITPFGMTEQHLTYGGHPANARLWAVNMAMDLLRHTARDSGQ